MTATAGNNRSSSRHRLGAIFLATAFVGVSGAAWTTAEAAQPTAPWFGLPLPGPATDNVLDYSQADIAEAPAPDASSAPELEGSKLHKYVKDIVDFSFASRAAGDRLWGRFAGGPWAVMTNDYVERELRSAGFAVERFGVPFTGPQVISKDWKVTLIGAPEFGPGTGSVELRSSMAMGAPAGPTASPAFTNNKRSRSVRAPLVYVGAGTAADIATVDVKGKVAITRQDPVPTPYYNGERQTTQGLIDAGAVAVVTILNTPGNMQHRFGGSCNGAPCYSIGGEDGDFLNTVIARAATSGVAGKLEMELTLEEDLVTNGSGEMLIAKLPGRNQSAENLVVGAHSDAWLSGANDNASGVAALIGLAKHYAKAPQLDHDIYFVLAPGHHSPTGPGLTAFAQRYPEVPRNNIITLSLEHIGQQAIYRSYVDTQARQRPQQTKYGTFAATYIPVNGDSIGRQFTGSPITPTLKRVVAQAAARTGLVAPSKIFEAVPGGELPNFIAAGATGLQNVETSMFYHTSGDTAESISPVTMQRVSFFFKDILEQMDKLTRAQVREGR